ncbi:AGE family epimerase/isomerase [Ensifer sp. Root127]|uniref:AGE family epimerase/isomerase n=1 Tax=Ensifer sp. Root127 TaxID=1736440 RepID=UPI000710EF5E|nr:AGE family epimerase/isomerase [Ensifer sp. Root127]KQW76824.1 mannose-6-phosphate isomerase [Ensifer sp. Root127]
MITSSNSTGSKLPDFWLDQAEHRAWLLADAGQQFAFFRKSLDPRGGFFNLDSPGNPLEDRTQDLHSTTRIVHSFALGRHIGTPGADVMIEQGMRHLLNVHRDRDHGGYVYATRGREVSDGRKLAYGHVFVLLAAASAMTCGHPDAKYLLEDVTDVLDRYFWEEEPGLFADEWNRDWTPFSTYRGMNANMHAIEAMLTAFEATGQTSYLRKAGRILDFFIEGIAPREGWRLPEHYTADWQIDRLYEGNPMFRPAGSTPGHSFELSRLLLQYWDLSGRPHDGSPAKARRLMEQALKDAWDTERGGFIYTLAHDGTVARADRYWWPVTEAIGAVAAVIKLERRSGDEEWYRRLWNFAADRLIDHQNGGWFPELDTGNRPADKQFRGKPDLYHSIQAVLYPLTPGISYPVRGLAVLGREH